jgi:hypothetical protein
VDMIRFANSDDAPKNCTLQLPFRAFKESYDMVLTKPQLKFKFWFLKFAFHNKVEAPIRKSDLIWQSIKAPTYKSTHCGHHAHPKMSCMELIHLRVGIYLDNFRKISFVLLFRFTFCVYFWSVQIFSTLLSACILGQCKSCL